MIGAQITGMDWGDLMTLMSRISQGDEVIEVDYTEGDPTAMLITRDGFGFKFTVEH